MKAISILQPWASLCVHKDENGKALKQIETRSWNTKYRGELLIHASKKNSHMFHTISNLYEFMNNGVYHQYTSHELPYGAIIGKVELIGVLPVENLRDSGAIDFKSGQKWIVTEQERAFGDYSANRFGWLLSDPVLFDKPIPCKGQLGLWNFDLDLYHHPQYKHFK